MKKALAMLALWLGGISASYAAGDIHVVELRGVVHPVSVAYIEEAIDRADADGAAALIIEIDTPGGLVDSIRDLVKHVVGARTPVIGFVAPSGARAASAGFLLLIACDAAAMAPGTNTGAAHPVALGGENRSDDIEMQKAESDFAAYARSIAQKRGRNVKLAESGVTESRSWTEREALEGGLIDAVASDVPELLKALDGKKVKRWSEAEVVLDLKGRIVPSPAKTVPERVKSFLLRTEVAFFMLGIGVLGIYIELSHPGLIFPGAVGVVALLLFAYAATVLPVSFFGLLLVATSIVLFVLEIKFPTHGALGTGGVVALCAGSLLVFNGPIPEMRVRPLIVLPVSLAIAGVMFLIARYVVLAHREHVATGREGMVGEVGVAATDLAPDGKIFVHGEYWNAHAATPIERGAKVRIRAVEEMHVLVDPAGRN